MFDGPGQQSILEVVRRRTPPRERRHRGAGYREYLPGLEILPCVRPGEAKILSVTGKQGPRNSPVAGLARDGPVPITRFAERQSR